MMTTQTQDSGTQEKDLKVTVRGLMVWAAFSVFLILAYALAAWGQGLSKVISIFSHGALISIAFSSVGSLTGFLFGIPRTLQSASPSPPKDKQSPDSLGSPGGDSGAYQQTVNTNLEQISDWLTKILVGVGLTQLQHIPEKLKNMAAYFQPGLGANAPITLVILLNAMVFGFFAGYLLTRLFLAGAFYGADNLTKKEQFARGLTEAGAYRKAIITLEAALAQLGPATPADTRKNIYESLTYNYLYIDAPEGFQKATEYGEAYTSQDPDSSARIWAYLAAAYGQQYKWELGHGKRQAVLDSARKKALAAIDKALKIDPRIKSLLRLIWDPNDPGKVEGSESQEDDLEVFHSDPEFKKLLD